MARAIVGTGTGYGSAPKIRLDDDCGATRPCGRSGGVGTLPPDGGGELDHLPVLALMLRQRVSYNADGIPEFDWVSLSQGRAILYEVRDEWDAVAGATVVKANMVIPNIKGIDLVPETAVVK